MSLKRANQDVPEHIWRTTMHYHDLIYIKYYWESIGQPTPPEFAAELERTHKRLMARLEEENTQGGQFYGVEDETGKSE